MGFVESDGDTASFNQIFKAYEQGDILLGRQILNQAERKASLNRLYAREILAGYFHDKLWIGPDIAAAEEIIIEPDNPTEIRINIPTEMQIPSSAHLNFFSAFTANTRSRFAQLGLEILPDATREIGEQIQKGIHINELRVMVNNYSKRSILLTPGSEFFYMYFWSEKTLEGKKLLERMGTDIQIFGTQGKDWQWWYGNYHDKNEENIRGIKLLINPDSRRWISPDVNNTPMNIDHGPAILHNRSAVDSYLTSPVPETYDHLLWIGETSAHMKLSSKIHGIVDQYINSNSINYQTNSRILKGGNTDSHIRTEIFSATIPHLIPRAILVQFTI